ncbi:MAG: peptide deformylase [Caldisericaceae bacterium]
MKIYTYGNPILRKKAKRIKNIDKALLETIDSMFRTMEESSPKGVGLAATQVGLNIALFVYKLDDDEGVVINPEIIDRSGSEIGEEGCLSVPGIYAPIERAEKVIVRGIDGKGNRVKYEVTGLKARVFQHETDHLNGILFTDYVDSIDNLYVEEGHEVPEELIEKILEK